MVLDENGIGMKVVWDESGFGMKVVLDESGFGMTSATFISIWMKLYLTGVGHQALAARTRFRWCWARPLQRSSCRHAGSCAVRACRALRRHGGVASLVDEQSGGFGARWTSCASRCDLGGIAAPSIVAQERRRQSGSDVASK